MGSEPARLRAIVKDPQHFKRVIDSLQLFKRRQDFMDLLFVCARGERVSAHKLLLCSVSPQMTKMFLELPDNIGPITIHLPDIEARILDLMFQFLYEGALRVDENDRKEFENVKRLLGVVIDRLTPIRTTNQQPPESTTPLAQSQPMPPQPVYFMQAHGPNNQGQMQYVLAAPGTLSQGQMMQMTQAAAPGQLIQVSQATPSGQMVQVAKAAAPGQMMQVAQAPAPGQMMQVAQAPAPGQMIQVAQAPAPGQMMQVAQATAPDQMVQVAQATAPGQMMQVAQAQAGGQVVQVATPNTSVPQGQIMQMAPAIMTQSRGQGVQATSQVVSTTIQQSNIMQVVPQNNNQMMPMVAGSQMVQCSSQMVVQAGQPTMMNSNQMSSNIQNQDSSSQRQQYVLASSANQMPTSRARVQYTQPQTTSQQRTVARSRMTTQVAQPIRNIAVNSVRTRRMMRGAPMPMAQNRSIIASRNIQRSRHSAQ